MKVASWPGPSTGMANPFIRLWAEALEHRGASVVDFSPGGTTPCDVVHVHWPEWVLDARPGPRQLGRTARLLAGLARARRRGARVVWTVHNLGAHETFVRAHPPLRWASAHKRLAWALFTRQVDGFVSLTDAGVAPVRERFPRLHDVPGFVIPHGHYRDAYPNEVSRDDARAMLGVSSTAKVALFLGQVRPYKNVPELVRVYREIDERDDLDETALLIAGRPAGDELAREVEVAAASDARVRLRLELVPADEVQRFMNAADLVVLPYRETLNSGAALLALSFDRPVLAPAAGAFVELEGALGGAWVRTYAGRLTATTLKGALAAPAPPGRAPLDAFSWDCVATKTLAAYEELRNLRQ